MTRVEGGRGAQAAGTDAPKSPAPALAEKVFSTAAASSDPKDVLALGSADGPQKGYRVLAQRLHPDRATGLDDASKARVEEAFKLAKAAWEACPENRDYKPEAAAYYETARPVAKAQTKAASSAAPPTHDRYAAETERANAARDAFWRAQAEAAEKAAQAERAGRQAARENALASARMSLGGTATALDGGAKVLEEKLGVMPSSTLGARITALAAEVAKMPLKLERFDARAPDARQRFEAFKEGTIGGLRRAREALPELAKSLEKAEAAQKVASDQLAGLRRALSEARNSVDRLRENGAPAAEIERWEAETEDRADRVDALAGKVKNEVHVVQELKRQLEKLSASVPYLERQAWSDYGFKLAEPALETAFGLTRASFGTNEAEWKLRIQMVEKGLTKTLDTLQADARGVIPRAHAGSFDYIRTSLVLYMNDVATAAARLGTNLSDDVKGAIAPELRARAEAVLADVAKLKAATVEVKLRNGTKAERATHVRELHDPKLEAAWNQEVDFSIDFDRRREEARWAGRDPNKFY